jgi:DNA polymerase III epsilon subunit-like protein
MIVLFDTETTSLLAPEAGGQEQQPRIIELGAVKYNFQAELVDRLNIIMNPRVPITDEITRITGYTDEKVRGFKPFAAHWRHIAMFWRDATLCVGHNIMFDKKVLYWELVRIGKEMNFPWAISDVCTADTCNKVFGHRKNLTDLHTHYFGHGFEGAHGAMADVEASARVFWRMVNEGAIANPAQSPH